MIDIQEYLILFGVIICALILFNIFMREPILEYNRNAKMSERQKIAAHYRNLYTRRNPNQNDDEQD